MWEIRRYEPSMKQEWDAFVDAARNATFLFRRDYMDYHSDRFADHSLMACRNGRLAAILPANISGSTLHSHQGLTYGGWVWKSTGLDTTDIFSLWRLWLEKCREEGIETIVYKPLPYIYAEMPSQEDLYMLFLSGASFRASNIATVIDLESNPGFDKLQRRHLKNGANEFEIRQISGEGTDEFHKMLSECLDSRYGVSPVHTAGELRKLIEDNSDNIVIWGSFHRHSGELMAGICVFETGMTAHCQYIATTPRGRALDALPALVAVLVNFYGEEGVRYLDFGTSNEDGGLRLNAGLNRQKTSFGGSGVVYPCYEISVISALKTMPTSLWPGR